MQLTTIVPDAEIARFIHHFWVFESATGLPAGDARIVVPNGRHKLIIPFRNGLTASGAGFVTARREGEPMLIGLFEEPTVISSAAVPTTTIGVEFVPQGLRRFLAADLDELTRVIIPIGDALGRLGEALAARLGSAATTTEAVQLAQAFLLEQFRGRAHAGPDLIDHALWLMAASGFTLEVNELERQLGYSRRHIAEQFRRKIGLSPKRLSSVLAFERLYRRFSRHRSASLLRDDALDVFYDQSHFIRHFRRFTGVSPTRFAEFDNEFGRIFYLGDSTTSQTSNPARPLTGIVAPSHPLGAFR